MVHVIKWCCCVEMECGTSGKMLFLACENGMAYAVDVASRKQVKHIS